MSQNSEQPIIIRRKKGGHGGHHGGAWKVAFADFMTAMMAFFLVMWLVGQEDDVKQAVAGYFRDPGQFLKQGGAGVLEGSKTVIPNESSPMSPTKNKDEKGAGPSEAERQELSLAAKSILQELEKQPAFRRLKSNIRLHLTSEGLRIILNESENSPAFFEPGSAKLLQKSAIILITIARELGNLKNQIVVEGHTDASHAENTEYTNWELSADRANSARALMEVSGLNAGQVREVRGFADSFPMIIERPNDARNRRVTIVVLYQSRDHRYDQLEVGKDLMKEIYK